MISITLLDKYVHLVLQTDNSFPWMSIVHEDPLKGEETASSRGKIERCRAQCIEMLVLESKGQRFEICSYLLV